MLAARALARLAGVLGGGLASPACMEARNSLGVLLTDALARRLTELDPRPLLRELNSNIQNPQACIPFYITHPPRCIQPLIIRQIEYKEHHMQYCVSPSSRN